MADFRTPLPIHRAAFARVAPTLALPADGLEALRKAFQAAERSGDTPRMFLDVRETLGGFVWCWPWFEECARSMRSAGVWPHAYPGLGISPKAEWQGIPHTSKCHLVTEALAAAVQSEREMADLASLKRDGGLPAPRLLLHLDNERCAASAWAMKEHSPAIERGDLRNPPPYFPGCAVSLRVKRRTR